MTNLLISGMVGLMVLGATAVAGNYNCTKTIGHCTYNLLVDSEWEARTVPAGGILVLGDDATAELTGTGWLAA